MKEKKDATVRIHVGLVLAEVICWSAFIFEVKRAIAGNTLSWATSGGCGALAPPSPQGARRMFSDGPGRSRRHA